MVVAGRIREPQSLSQLNAHLKEGSESKTILGTVELRS